MLRAAKIRMALIECIVDVLHYGSRCPCISGLHGSSKQYVGHWLRGIFRQVKVRITYYSKVIKRNFPGTVANHVIVPYRCIDKRM
jgi:hypothetical protein